MWACACGSRDDEHVAAAASARRGGVRLVVLVIIDQLPSWSFDAILPSLHGGFARLIERGVHFPRGEIPFSNTFTASGHAAIGTGAPPSVTGILANDWHRQSGDRSLGATVDLEDMNMVSSSQLRVEGVADVLERATAGKSHTVSLSLKDRSAILATGRRPDLAIWYDPERAVMTTNSFYAAEPPAWLRDLASDRPPSRFFRAEWRPNDRKLLVRLSGSSDDQPGELGNDGLDATFPHSLAQVPKPNEAIVDTPFGTEILFDAADAALRGENMGTDDVPDLLSISVSSLDYAGHGWGQESWERVDLMLRLDERLGAFLDHLDATVGASRYAVVMTSDHGATRLIERQQAAGAPVFRVLKPQIRAAAERAARKVLGAGPWVRGVSGNLVFVVPAFADQPAAQRATAIREMVAGIGAIAGMGLVAATADIAGDCSRHRDPARRMACLSLPDGPLGPIVTLPSEGSEIAGSAPWGAAHGGLSADERIVPIAIVAPGRAHARHDESVSLLRVAPTVSALLGIAPPAAARERSLLE
ncbi:MAG TPA: alkaline phosphatase family protein [Kofleriaceae bacterium]|nr:alkaline phosphatase family protein [Kofleriaceae bacterium]